MAAQDGGVPGGGLDRVVLAELLGRFHAMVGGAAREAMPRGGGPDPISQWTATEQGEGPPLCAMVDMLGPLPPDAVAALAVGIAAELSRMHAAGTLHRRLTPSNVLLPETGPRLVHSGVPHTMDGATVTDLDGSPLVIGYLTPEQVLGQPIGPETDVFALGGVLAFAASGVPPFGSDEPLAVLYRIVNEEPVLDAVPDSLRGLVKACLSKLPAQRPTLPTLIARANGVLKDARVAQDRTGDALVETQAGSPVATDARVAQGATQQATDVDSLREPNDTRLMPGLVPSRLTSIPMPVTHRRRRRSTNAAVLGVVIIGVAAAFLVRGVAESSTPSSRQSGVLPAPPVTATTSHVASSAPAAALPGVFVAGPGCPPSPWASIAESVAASSALVPNLGGGLADCGGRAIAFLKNGKTTPGVSSFTWTFRLGRSAHCALSVYISAADASSGYAHYQLFIPAPSPATAAAATATGSPTAAAKPLVFQINQSVAKGRWVDAPELAGLSLPDGSVQLVLTDAGAYAGDRFHVTASAVRASCSPAA